METSKKQQRTRRGFILGAAAAGAAAGAVSALPLVQHASQEQEPQAETSEDRPQGYRLTDHIQRYYRTTRI